MNLDELKTHVGQAFADREKLKEYLFARAVRDTMELLDRGAIRVAAKGPDGWQVNAWVKEAILLFFSLQEMKVHELPPFEFHDKIPLKKGLAEAGVRVVPNGTVRYGAFLERGAVVMPSFVNIGAYVGGGTMDLAGLSVLAFQRLWNRNHPEDVISEDGAYGPQTEARILRSPAEGFAVGPGCDEPPPPAPFGIDWTRDAGGVYVLTATADAAVDTVEYLADGRRLGQVSAGPAGDFALAAGTCALGGDHTIEAIARDASGAEITRGVALLEALASTAVYVRPRAPSTYEIGLERPSAAVAAIEVDADGTPLTDTTTGVVRSTRNAVLHTFTLLGARTFVVRLYDATGTALETRTVALTLR